MRPALMAFLVFLGGALLCLAAFVAFAQFDGSDMIAVKSSRVVRVSEDTVAIQGIISRDSMSQLGTVLRTGDATVLLRSGGGDVVAAVEMARLIRAKGLITVVDGLCASSCANYLFPAGKKQRVLPGGLVLLHGGATLEPTPELTARFPKTLARRLDANAVRLELERVGGVAIDSAPVKSEQTLFREFQLTRMLVDTSDLVAMQGVDEALSIAVRWRVLADGTFTREVTIVNGGAASNGKTRMLLPTKEDWRLVGNQGLDDYWRPENEAAAQALFQKYTGKLAQIEMRSIEQIRDH